MTAQGEGTAGSSNPSARIPPAVRILPFEAPPEGELSMPLDTGHDSLFSPGHTSARGTHLAKVLCAHLTCPRSSMCIVTPTSTSTSSWLVPRVT